MNYFFDLPPSSEEEPSTIVGDGVCVCKGTEVGDVASREGLTCQQLYTRAYTQLGYSDTVARAMFVLFLEGRITPKEITEYTNKISATKDASEGKCEENKVFCMGCFLHPLAQQNLRDVYRMIKPGIFENGGVTDADLPLPLSESDQLYMQILNSGILDEEEDWRDLSEMEEDEF